MSYNILNKGVKFQGDTQGTIEDIVDTHSTQTINGLKTITHLTGTHVRVTNDATVLGNVSASINISASAFYGDGANLTNVGSVTALNNRNTNRLVTIASTTTELDGETFLTFDGDTRTLTVGGADNPSQSGSIVFHYGQISGSGNISGSAFFGDGSNLTGVQTVLKSNAGLNYDSDELEIKFDTLDTPAGGIDGSADKMLIYDNNVGALKQVAPNDVANLFDAAVTQMNNKVENRLVTIANSTSQLDGEANLTFDGNILTVDGNFSGSGYVSASNVVVAGEGTITAPGISLGNTLGIAGNGLFDSGGKLEVQVTGAIHTVQLAAPRYHIGITGSIAGNGLSFGGGVNSISSLAVNLDSNSGLAVAGSGLKTNFATLTSATPDVAADSIVFVDSGGDAKCSISTFLNQIAGANLGVSGSQLTASSGGGGAVSAVANGSDNRITTFSSTDSLNGEANLQFDGTTLSINGAEGDAGAYSKIVVRKTSIADNSATAIVRFTIPNANHAAGFKIFGIVTTDSGSRVGTFEQSVAISRISGATAVGAVGSGVLSAEANSGGGGADYTIASTITQSGGAGASNTIDYNLQINTTDGSPTNAVFYVELLNFNSTGITMAAV